MRLDYEQMKPAVTGNSLSKVKTNAQLTDDDMTIIG